MQRAHVHPVAVNGGHRELQESVVDQDTPADADVLRDVIVGDGDLVSGRHGFMGEDHRLPVGDLQRRREIADPNARPLQIAEDRHRPSRVLGQPTDGGDGPGVLFVRPV